MFMMCLLLLLGRWEWEGWLHQRHTESLYKLGRSKAALVVIVAVLIFLVLDIVDGGVGWGGWEKWILVLKININIKSVKWRLSLFQQFLVKQHFSRAYILLNLHKLFFLLQILLSIHLKCCIIHGNLYVIVTVFTWLKDSELPPKACAALRSVVEKAVKGGGFWNVCCEGW